MSYLKKFLVITLIFAMQFQSIYASTAINGWNLGNPVVNGATTTYEVTKEAAGKIFKGTVSVSPSTAQIAKGLLRGGLVGLAISAVTQALLDGIDYVMDPANNEIRYKPKNPVGFYWVSNHTRDLSIYETPELACKAFIALIKADSGEYVQDHPKEDQINGPGYCSAMQHGNSVGQRIMYSLDQSERKTPISDVASKIINLANQGNPAAKDYVASVAQDLVENDEEYRKSLKAQLDAKLQEAQNSGNNSATKPVPSTSGNSTTANPTPPNNDDEEDANQKIDRILKNSRLLKKARDNDKSTNNIYEKNDGGGFEQVMKDFNSLGLKNIRNVTKKPDEVIYIGQLRNNTWVTARSWSKLDGRPTLEITSRRTKIRY